MPTNPTRVVRRIGTVPYVSGQRQTLEIDKDGVLFTLRLKLSCRISAGATPGTGSTIGGLSRLLRRIEVIAGGRDTLQSVPGYQLAIRSQIETGQGCYGLGDTDAERAEALNIAANSSRDFVIVVPVSFGLPLGRRIDDCGLDTFGINQLALAVTWGDVSDLYATPGTAALSLVALEVEGDYLINPTRKSPYYVRTLDYQDVDVTATNSEMAITLDNRTGLILGSVMVFASNDWQGSDSIVRGLRLQSGSFVYQARDVHMMRAEMKQGYNVKPPAGVMYIEPRFDGQITNAILTDAGNMTAELKLTGDVVKGAGYTRLSIQREGIRTLMQ